MKLELEKRHRTAVLLDPHPLCHAALAELLGRFDIDLVGATKSTSTALALLQEHRPDLLVTELDLAEGREAALGLLQSGRRNDPGLTVIVLSNVDDPALVDAAFQQGVSAYILKTSDVDVIATAIRQAFEPSLYLPPRQEYPVAAASAAQHSLCKLTRRELEILQLVAGSRSNRQVAEILWVTDQTVKFHLANVYRKLGVRSRFEAVRWARENGFLETGETADVIAMPRRTENGNGNGRVAFASMETIGESSQ